MSVTVAICLKPFLSSSIGAKLWGLLVDFRSLAARRARRTGPKVSGRKKRGSQVAPATMRPIQKAQRHPRAGDMKPDIKGAIRGPTQVPYNSL